VDGGILFGFGYRGVVGDDDGGAGFAIILIDGYGETFFTSFGVVDRSIVQ